MNQNPKTPNVDFFAYNVLDRDGQKPIWSRIGIAFRHKDGKGLNIQLNALPVDGRLTLREPEEVTAVDTPAQEA
jgi:hypothetical protein